ncbi:MAG: hypothetical protein QM817_04775 [Archangium sp.]
MKLDAKTASTAVQATASKTAVQPFKQLLAEARAELKPKPPVVAPVVARAGQTALSSTTATAASQVRQQARAHAETEASRLGTVRADHSRHVEAQQNARAQHTEAVTEKSEGRVLDLIVRELSADATPSNSTPPPTPTAELAVRPALNAAAALQQSKIEVAPETKASQAVALIEKIITFVRSQRPGLALTLNNSLGASVEIERIGPKEIALKLIGQFGPPSADAVSRIRDELRARGLKIGALSVA